MAKKGSTKVKCKAYRDSKIRIINKKRRLNKHIKLNPQDQDAARALKALAA